MCIDFPEHVGTVRKILQIIDNSKQFGEQLRKIMAEPHVEYIFYKSRAVKTTRHQILVSL